MNYSLTEPSILNKKEASEYLTEKIKQYDVIFSVSNKKNQPKHKEFEANGYDIGINKDQVAVLSEGYLFAESKLSTGVKSYLSQGLRINLYTRSSSFDKYNGIMLKNNTGIIESSYRGEILANCLFLNDYFNIINDRKIFTLYENNEQNEKIDYFQMVIEYSLTHNVFFNKKRPLKILCIANEFIYNNWSELLPSERGSGGFGSTNG